VWFRSTKREFGGLSNMAPGFPLEVNSAQRTYLEVSRALVKAAHGEDPPLVVDPFAGGGSIPLEALRLGCEAFASDLNPVACPILKVMLEDIPRYGPNLADELRRVGAEIKRQAENELADIYPEDGDGATPIAYQVTNCFKILMTLPTPFHRRGKRLCRMRPGLLMGDRRIALSSKIR